MRKAPQERHVGIDMRGGNNLELTICSVSFHNARHLSLNWELADRLTRGDGRLRWVIAENTPDGSEARLDPHDRRFLIIPGVDDSHRDNYQHTEALHKCFEHVRTRFLLVLDPDFYIVRPHWLRDVLGHMQRNDLAMLGVPWHPKYTDKYRYFPCVHCFFVDLGKIGIDALDFRPGCDDEPTEIPSDRTSVPRPSAAARWLGIDALRHRRKDYRDTGTRMYLRYRRDPRFRYECAIPVYKLPDDYQGSGNPLGWRSRLIESMLPDSLCYLPKRKDSYQSQGFLGRRKGAPSEFWEEFMWQGAPFGFHVRRNARKGERNAAAELDALEKAVATFHADASG
jgi:hypothetical protein